MWYTSQWILYIYTISYTISNISKSICVDIYIYICLFIWCICISIYMVYHYTWLSLAWGLKKSPGGAYAVQPVVQPAHGVMERAYRTPRVICRCMQYLKGRVAGGSWKPFKQKTAKYSFWKHTVWERLKDFVTLVVAPCELFSKAPLVYPPAAHKRKKAPLSEPLSRIPFMVPCFGFTSPLQLFDYLGMYQNEVPCFPLKFTILVPCFIFLWSF